MLTSLTIHYKPQGTTLTVCCLFRISYPHPTLTRLFFGDRNGYVPLEEPENRTLVET